MPATATATSHNFENRKLQLITRIAQMDDEAVLSLIEDLVDEDFEAVLTKEETAIVEQRLADFKAKPNEFVTLDQLAGKIQNMQ